MCTHANACVDGLACGQFAVCICMNLQSTYYDSMFGHGPLNQLYYCINLHLVNVNLFIVNDGEMRIHCLDRLKYYYNSITIGVHYCACARGQYTYYTCGLHV